MAGGDNGCCDLCGDPVDSRPWVLLNRFGYGSGKCRGMTEVQVDGVCVWEVGDDLDAEQEVVSGWLLCFPGCLQMFLEGKMLQAEIDMGKV